MRTSILFGDAAWTPETVPPSVRSAVLLLLTHLHDHLGENMETDEDLRKAISQQLMPLRNPAFA